MKSSPMLVGLTIVNVTLLLVSIAQQWPPAFADGGSPVLRGRALENIDGRDRVRASLNVLPASPANDCWSPESP